jgi:UbiD family decarboxylase
MAAARQGKPYRVVKTAKGLDVPWGSEYVLEGRVLAGQREMEGPFGEFPGYYSGGHRYPVVEIDRVSHRKNPIFESVYVGRPWTELDFLQAMTTSAPIFVQLNKMFPEVIAPSTRSIPMASSSSCRRRRASAASPSPSEWACSRRPTAWATPSS